jgi:hypothetical protein
MPEKIRVAEVVNKFCVCYGTQKFITFFLRNSQVRSYMQHYATGYFVSLYVATLYILSILRMSSPSAIAVSKLV